MNWQDIIKDSADFHEDKTGFRGYYPFATDNFYESQFKQLKEILDKLKEDKFQLTFIEVGFLADVLEDIASSSDIIGLNDLLKQWNTLAKRLQNIDIEYRQPDNRPELSSRGYGEKGGDR
tara:strand:- start:16866 stop:17225 length:360 start_codon:yes stop_codon:yes gene_type:complete